LTVLDLGFLSLKYCSHGGNIWSENNSDDKGAAFSFSIPLSSQ
jgi:signal transduction histidine kinase